MQKEVYNSVNSHQAEQTAVLSWSRAGSAGVTVVKIVKTTSSFFLQQSKCNSDCLLPEEERVTSTLALC